MAARAASVAMILLASFAWTALAGNPRADADRDVLQTIQARKKLAAEPDLVGHNIGVVVRNRVATLWGPVASAEIAFRAELCLRTMVELASVRNELFVSDQLNHRPAAPAKIELPPVLLPDRLPPKLPIDPLRVPEVQPAVESAKSSPAAAIQVSREADTPPMPQAELLTQAERELTAGVRTILQSKPAYRDVQFAVQESRVYLKTTGSDTNALHEIARAVARLPNVSNVIVLEKAR